MVAGFMVRNSNFFCSAVFLRPPPGLLKMRFAPVSQAQVTLPPFGMAPKPEPASMYAMTGEVPAVPVSL